ncbi:MAG: PTS transporter subunit EIIC [Longibaculum sp.]
MNYKQVAKEIISLVGEKDNITNVIHCVTRLRFFLKDESLANTKALKSKKEVLGVIQQGGQYQVVIGQEVSMVYDEIQKELSGQEMTVEKSEKKKNIVVAFLETLTGTITPVIGFLGAAGILKGILSILTTFHWLSSDAGAYILLNALADSLFYFFPIILGFSAGKKLDTNPFIPAIIGGALVHPTIIALVGQNHLSFFGLPITLMNYASSVFPIIVAAWLCSYVEKWFNKILPATVRSILTPLLTITIVGVITFLAVGPIVTMIGNGIASAVLAVYDFSPIITGLLIGAFWQILVVFGLHWGLIPIVINNVLQNGFDPLMAMLGVSILCQIGAALGVALKTKDGEVKEIAIAATISALFGVTEPALYGLTLKYKKVLIASCIGGGIAGAVTGLLHASYFGVAGGIFGALSAINPAGIDISFYAFFISFAIAVLGSAILIYVIGYED